MKKLRKFAAMAVLVSMSMSYGNVLHSEYTQERLVHTPFWIMKKGQADYTKRKQLCEKEMSFYKDHEMCDYLVKTTGEIEKKNQDASIEGKDEAVEIDDFLNDLFWSEEEAETTTVESTTTEEWDDGEIDDLLNDLFGSNEETETAEVEEEEENASTQSADTSTESESELWDDDLDNLLKDLFGANMNKILIWADARDGNISLPWKKLLSVIREYNKQKSVIASGDIRVDGIRWDNNYNSAIMKFISNADDSLHVKSIKEALGEKVSNLTYSYAAFTNTDHDVEIREAFKTKLISDIQSLKKKYGILKRKDVIIAKWLASRKAS